MSPDIDALGESLTAAQTADRFSPVESAQVAPAALRENLELIHRTLLYYANVCTYQGERTGGVLAGCPRGPEPTPDQLANEARLVLRRFEPWARAALAAEPVKPQEPGAMRLLDNDAPTVSQNELRRMLDGIDASAKSFGLVLMTDFKGCLSLAMLDAAPKAVKPQGEPQPQAEQ